MKYTLFLATVMLCACGFNPVSDTCSGSNQTRSVEMHGYFPIVVCTTTQPTDSIVAVLK